MVKKRKNIRKNIKASDISPKANTVEELLKSVVEFHGIIEVDPEGYTAIFKDKSSRQLTVSFTEDIVSYVFLDRFGFRDSSTPEGSDQLEVVNALLSGDYQYVYRRCLILPWKERISLRVKVKDDYPEGSWYADDHFCIRKGERYPDPASF